MLAQNFLAHEVLGITQEEQTALIKVLGMFERGEMVHVNPRQSEPWAGNAFPKHFNMGHWNSLAECGTVCCIGGAAAWVGGFAPAHFQRIGGNKELTALLFCHHSGGRWNSVSVEQAASALRNFLTLGEPRWREVLNVEK